MSKMIQIRNVPDAVHKRLKARAAEEGTSVSELLLREAIRVAGRPSNAELFERWSKLPPLKLSESTAETIRRMREERSGQLLRAALGERDPA